MYSDRFRIALVVLGSVGSWSIVTLQDVHARPETTISAGLRFTERELPGGCESEGGTMLSGPGKRSVMQIRCGATRYGVLARMLEQDGSNAPPRWEAVDVAVLPALQRGQSVNDTDCTGPGPGYVLAVAHWRHGRRRSEATRIAYAIRVREGGERFEGLEPRQVKCSFNDDRD